MVWKNLSFRSFKDRMRRKNVFRNRNIYDKNELEVNSDNKAANFCEGRHSFESHRQFSVRIFVVIYHKDPSNLSEDKRF